MESYAALLRGDTASLEGLHLWSTGSKVRIATKARVPVAMDGSLFCKTPIRVGVAPKALRVMVPSAAALTA
jgi:diacylglycerol kinase family enzyme